MADRPVTISGLVLTLALAILAVAAYYWHLSAEEMALWSAVLAALAALLHVGLNQLTTPKAKPMDGTHPLVSADDGQPGPTAAAQGRFIVKDAMPRGANGTRQIHWSK